MRRRLSEVVFFGLWVLTALGFAGVYFIIGAQQAVAQDLSHRLKLAEQAIIDGDWRSAAETVNSVDLEWRRIEKIWALHTQHEQLESIGEALVEAGALIDVHDARAVAALRMAQDRLQTLPQRDRLLWSNLL